MNGYTYSKRNEAQGSIEQSSGRLVLTGEFTHLHVTNGSAGSLFVGNKNANTFALNTSPHCPFKKIYVASYASGTTAGLLAGVLKCTLNGRVTYQQPLGLLNAGAVAPAVR